jgi:hypothetical protein
MSRVTHVSHVVHRMNHGRAPCEPTTPRAARRQPGDTDIDASAPTFHPARSSAAGSTAMQPRSPERMIDALLIGVDLGPSLSIVGPLATVLWLIAIRREGENVTFMQLLIKGVWVMVPTPALALAERVVSG